MPLPLDALSHLGSSMKQQNKSRSRSPPWPTVPNPWSCPHPWSCLELPQDFKDWIIPMSMSTLKLELTKRLWVREASSLTPLFMMATLDSTEATALINQSFETPMSMKASRSSPGDGRVLSNLGPCQAPEWQHRRLGLWCAWLGSWVVQPWTWTEFLPWWLLRMQMHRCWCCWQLETSTSNQEGWLK